MRTTGTSATGSASDGAYSMLPALSRCHAKSASLLRLTDFQAAATASRHVVIAARDAHFFVRALDDLAPAMGR